jgi:uncharacterized Zn finger protein (UPF0148 family)
LDLLTDEEMKKNEKRLDKILGAGTMTDIKCPKCHIWWMEIVTKSQDGRILYGKCKTCGQVSVELDEMGEPVKPPRIPEAVVKANRSQWMSALIKAIRIGLEEEAAYWLSVFLISDGISQWYLARRILMSVFEDVANVSATKKAYGLFTEGIKDPEVERNLFETVLMLCRAPKFFSDPVARECTKEWLDTQEHPEKYQLYGEDKKSDQELLVSLQKAIGAKNFKHTWLIYNEILNNRKLMSYEDLSDLMLSMAVDLREHEKEYATLACEAANESARYGDQNSIFMMAQTITVGINDDEVEVLEEDVETAMKYKEFVQEQWKKSKLRKVAGWALDGIHTGSGDRLADRRFAGTTFGIKNMVWQYEKYGRLHPDDPGIVYKSYGDWKLEYEKVSEGVYQMRSQTGNGFYEVDVVKNTCTCPAFRNRKGLCKHIKLLNAKLKIK